MRAALAVAALLVPAAAGAGEASVLGAKAVCKASRHCDFQATVEHADQGWQHYADAWEVLAPDGALLARRVLQHPHVGEQPFTRALFGVEVPEGIERVRIRARDSVHEYGSTEAEVVLVFPPAEPGSEPAP